MGRHDQDRSRADQGPRAHDRRVSGRARAAQVLHPPGRRHDRRLPAPGAHRLPPRRARRPALDAARADRRRRARLRQPPLRPLVRAVALGLARARRAGVSLGEGPHAADRTSAEEEEIMTTAPIYLRQLEIGPMQNYVYLVGDPETREAAVVDAAWEIDAIIEAAAADGYTITKALVTHLHPDHLGGRFMGMSVTGATELVDRLKIKAYINKQEAGYVGRVSDLAPSDVVAVDAGDTIEIGKVPLTFVHTPGHTPGSQCFLVDGNLISGDTLFIGSCGRTDLPGSDPAQLYESLNTLQKLPDDTVLHPGHNYADRPTSTIGHEKRRNLFMRFDSLEDFLNFVGR